MTRRDLMMIHGCPTNMELYPANAEMWMICFENRILERALVFADSDSYTTLRSPEIGKKVGHGMKRQKGGLQTDPHCPRPLKITVRKK